MVARFGYGAEAMGNGGRARAELQERRMPGPGSLISEYPPETLSRAVRNNDFQPEQEDPLPTLQGVPKGKGPSTLTNLGRLYDSPEMARYSKAFGEALTRNKFIFSQDTAKDPGAQDS